MKIGLGAIQNLLCTCLTSQIARACFQGNQIYEIFQLDPPLLGDYFQ